MFIKRLGHIFTSKEKIRFGWLIVAILLMGVLEVIGIASILPFMQLIAEPDAIANNIWLNRIYHFFEFESERSMIIAIGLGVIVILAISNLFAVFTNWLQYCFSWDMSHQFGIRLLKTYIHKPYSFYLNQNTSALRAYLTAEVVVLSSGVLLPIIEVISRGMVSIVIFALLLVVNPTIAITTLLILGGTYAIIYLVRQRYIERLGEDRILHNKARYQYINELLDGIKTIKAYEAQDLFYQRFQKASKDFTSIMPKYQLVRFSPKYILEIFAFGGILAITLYLFIRDGNIQQTLPILSLYAVAGYRLLPALQKAFGSMTKLSHNLPVLDKLYDDLRYALQFSDAAHTQKTTSLRFQQALSMENISFTYENAASPLLDQFSITIPKGKNVAFVGSTGSGKTTLVDLLVGLLHPQEGVIKLDDTPLTTKNISTWHQQIAYIPQEVFLFDDNITENITLGLGVLDKDRLENACKMADIYEFIVHELPQGFDTEIGERGVRLSGGQRQRLGLARALYRQPDVLIMDEATSALDNITEKSIISSLDTLPDNLTLIIIAHRLSSVRHVDCIYFLENGKIVTQGTYEELMQSNATFRTMVELS